MRARPRAHPRAAPRAMPLSAPAPLTRCVCVCARARVRVRVPLRLTHTDTPCVRRRQAAPAARRTGWAASMRRGAWPASPTPPSTPSVAPCSADPHPSPPPPPSSSPRRRRLHQARPPPDIMGRIGPRGPASAAPLPRARTEEAARSGPRLPVRAGRQPSPVPACWAMAPWTAAYSRPLTRRPAAAGCSLFPGRESAGLTSQCSGTEAARLATGG